MLSEMTSVTGIYQFAHSDKLQSCGINCIQRGIAYLIITIHLQNSFINVFVNTDTIVQVNTTVGIIRF